MSDKIIHYFPYAKKQRWGIFPPEAHVSENWDEVTCPSCKDEKIIEDSLKPKDDKDVRTSVYIYTNDGKITSFINKKDEWVDLVKQTLATPDVDTVIVSGENNREYWFPLRNISKIVFASESNLLTQVDMSNREVHFFSYAKRRGMDVSPTGVLTTENWDKVTCGACIEDKAREDSPKPNTE